MNGKENKTEIFLFPTDTVPGIGCFLSSDCVTKLRKIKKRSSDKPFPLLFADKKDVKNTVKELPSVYEKTKRLLPGGITLILKGDKNLPEGVLSSKGKVGIRIPNHKELRDFIRKNKKPLIATSANISGSETPKNLKEVDLPVDRIINGKSGSGKPSTVLDISGNSLVIYRKGAISIHEIEKITGQKVKLGPDIDFNVLFVCSANLCRSPMAEIHLKHLAKDLKRVNIRSAGINTITGMGLYEKSKEILEQDNLETKHTSKLLTKPMLDWADLIFVMEDLHKKYITYLSPENKNKVAFLRNFGTQKRKRIIVDPAGKNQ
ncbi:MAG: L-threonylcarbamoyladenylate synthase, partial [candidate division WOR-3 bacterium]